MYLPFSHPNVKTLKIIYRLEIGRTKTIKNTDLEDQDLKQTKETAEAKQMEKPKKTKNTNKSEKTDTTRKK